MKQLVLIIVTVFITINCTAQSLEAMTGSKRIFVDAQWLKPFDEKYRFTLFSRSRATVDYDKVTNLFTGAYLNYTTKSGFGGSLVGRVSSLGAGADAGLHFFKAKAPFMLFALAAIEIDATPGYSWFSIFRYTPKLNDNWKFYSSLELFSLFNADGHAASVQRIRAGLDYNDFQFGFALNLSGLGPEYSNQDSNPGLFIRQQF